MILKIKGIEEKIDIKCGEITEIVIENSVFFFKISKNFYYLDSENVFLYERNIIDNNKYIFVITNLLDLNPNSKKILASNYKYAENMLKTMDIFNKLFDLNNKAMEILEEASELFGNQTIYNDNIGIVELLNAYGFKFEFNETFFLDSFITYIKIITMFSNHKIIVTFNIQDFLNQEEFNLLRKEFDYLGLALINICSKKSNLSYNHSIIIDKDLCEIWNWDIMKSSI